MWSRSSAASIRPTPASPWTLPTGWKNPTVRLRPRQGLNLTVGFFQPVGNVQGDAGVGRIDAAEDLDHIGGFLSDFVMGLDGQDHTLLRGIITCRLQGFHDPI